jgi:ABC-type sugar transport system ATPase subunit
LKGAARVLQRRCRPPLHIQQHPAAVGDRLDRLLRPVNLLVVAFIGSPAMNLVAADLDGNSVQVGSQRLALPSGVAPCADVHRAILGIRPESL